MLLLTSVLTVFVVVVVFDFIGFFLCLRDKYEEKNCGDYEKNRGSNNDDKDCIVLLFLFGGFGVADVNIRGSGFIVGCIVYGFLFLESRRVVNILFTVFAYVIGLAVLTDKGFNGLLGCFGFGIFCGCINLYRIVGVSLRVILNGLCFF